MGDEADYITSRMQFPFDVRRKRRSKKPLVTCRDCLAAALYAGFDAHGCRAVFNQDGSPHVCDLRTVHALAADDFGVL